MKKYVNGEYIEMTAEEITELQASLPEVDQEPTIEDRLAALEALALAQLLGGAR